MRRFIFCSWSLLFCFLITSPVVWAQGGKGGGFMHPKRIERAMTKLGVSEAVKKQVQDLVYETRKGSIQLKAAAASERLELQKLLRAEQPDRNAVFGQLEKVSKAKLAIRKQQIGLMLSVSALLTPQQRGQLREMMERRRGKRQGRRRPRGGHDSQ